MSTLGAAQFPDASGSVALDELERFLEMVDQHTRHEDEMIAPLLGRHSRDRNLAWQGEHRELEVLETTLRKRLRDARDSATQDNGLSLYREFARFCAAMLEHLDKEETTLMPLLWQSCTDEDLSDLMKNFLHRYGAEAAQFHAHVANAYTPVEKAKLGL